MTLATSKLLNVVLCTSNISSKEINLQNAWIFLDNLSSFQYTLYTAGAAWAPFARAGGHPP